MFGRIGISEIVLIALVVLLLFGGKKIPELMKSLGKGIRSFKEGMNGVDEKPHEDAKNAPNGHDTHLASAEKDYTSNNGESSQQ